MISTFSSLWTTELGLAGLIVTSLVTLVFYIIAASNKREDKRAKCFSETLNEIHTLHKEERSEWREDANFRHKQTNDALKELSQAINDMIKDHNDRHTPSLDIR
jgi:gas vesicle protein